MAKSRIENGVEITIYEKNAFLGYERGFTKQHVIITDTKRVSTYCLTDNKCINSWSVRQNSTFTAKAIYDVHNLSYIAVQKNKNLLKWNKETTDLARIKPVVLSTPVHCLLSDDDCSTLVVFENGAVVGLQRALNEPKERRPSTLPDQFDMKGCTTCRHGNQRKVFIMACNAKDKVWRILISVEGSESPGQQLTLRNQDNAASVVNYSLLPVEGSVHIITAWSNGDICLSEVPFFTTADHVECCPLLTVESQTAVTWLGMDYFAVSGVKGLDKENANAEFLSIWDSKFGAIQAKVELPNTTDNNATSITAMEDTILMTRGATIVAYRFTCPHASLAVALGCLRNVSQNAITVEAEWKPNATKTAENIAKKENLLKEAMDDTKCSSEAEFASVCKRLLARLRVERLADSCYTTSLLQHIAARCKHEKRFWPTQTLINIVEFSTISASSCRDFLSIVLDKEDKDILSVCLKNMSDIPEDVIVNALQIYLRSHKDNGSTFGGEVCSPFDDALAHSINNLLNCKYNDVFLVERLKYLDLQEVLVLVKYLYYLLSTVDSPEEVKVEIVIEWICLLLDSHYSALVISNTAKTLLLRLYTAVEYQVQYCRQLQSLQGLLHPMLNSKMSTNKKPKQSNRLYSIEIVKLF